MQAAIAVLAIAAIALHLVLRYAMHLAPASFNIPLWVAYAFGGVPLVWGLLGNLARREFGSDLLAGMSIVTALILHEYLAGTLVILMLSGGEALEAYAVQGASSVLQALAKRMPSIAHRKAGISFEDIGLEEVEVGGPTADPATRDLPGGRHGHRRAQRDGRILPDRGAIHDFEDAGLDGHLRGAQR